METEHDDSVEQTEETDLVAKVENGQNSALTSQGSNLFRCDICPYTTRAPKFARAHMACHKYQPGSRLKCKYCPFFVDVKRTLVRHMQLHPEYAESGHSFPNPAKPQLGKEFKKPNEVESIDFTLKDGKLSCDQCPFKCKSRNGLIYHKQFHRKRPATEFKCRFCPYFVQQKYQLNSHERVHSPKYGKTDDTVTVNPNSVPMGSPTKSEITDYCDSVEMATLKQQIINSKIRSCPLTPEKFIPFEDGREGEMEVDESEYDKRYSMAGYVVDDDGKILRSGVLKKVHTCAQCPYTNVKLELLKLHEVMHVELEPRPKVVDVEDQKEVKEPQDPETEPVMERVFKCEYCSYNSYNKKLLLKHIHVHSQQYEPGHDNIIDFDDEEPVSPNEEVATVMEEEDDDPEIQLKKPVIETAPPAPAPEETIIKKPEADRGHRLDSGQLSTHFYLKFEEKTGKHILERVSVQKFNCDRCPYATLVRLNFERHVLLHGCKQRFACEFCDYSIHTYKLLLQHKKLHLMPNPNLLSMQSLSNLTKLPEIPADIAAAADFPLNKDDPISTKGVHDHLALYENSEEFLEPKQKYRCERCPFVDTHSENLLAHLRFHMNRSALPCSYCDFSASQQDVLSSHVKVHFANEVQPDSPPVSRVAEVPDAQPNGETSSKEDIIKTEEQDTKIKVESNVNDTSEKEPQNMDYAEFLALEEDGNNNKGKENEAEVGQVKVQIEVIGQIQVKVEESDSCICQYCDRSFLSPTLRQKHEKQHLVGQKVLIY